MAPLGEDRYLAALTAQSALFCAALDGADLHQQVPTCPEWTVYRLTEHLGRAHRFSTEIVTRRIAGSVHPGEFSVAPPPGDPDALAGWLRDGAAALVDALRAADPQTLVWSWAGEQPVWFWARRMAHETTVHRADLELARGREVILEPDLAADAISEWFGLLCSAEALRWRPELAELAGNGEILHLHSTDPGLGEAGEWIVRRTPAGPVWEHGHTKGAVAVRGRAADLLLVLLRRVAPDQAPVQVLGDPELLAHWLRHTRF